MRACCISSCFVVVLFYLSHAVGGFHDERLLKKFFLDDFWKPTVNYDPDAGLNVTQLITSKGYPCEDHSVVTDDGYILSVQRIPYGHSSRHRNSGPKPVVFLQHGLLGASHNWVENLANESLGFILADNGYDVWIGNVRGNTYSKRHVHLNPKSEAFWDFSFDEMAKYDIPAMLNYTLRVTNQSELYYAGHSQGTMVGFIEFGRNPELAKKVKIFFALAPVTEVKYIETPVRYLVYADNYLEALYNLLGTGDFLPSSDLMKWVAASYCTPATDVKICENALFLFAGFDVSNFNQSRLQVYMAHDPAGTSVKNMVHFAQLVRTGKFCMYDYGSPAENMKHYNQTTPPDYRVEDMQVPTVTYTASNDWLADPKDVANLLPKIQHLIKNSEIMGWNHMDFIWAMNAKDKVYNDMMQLMTLTSKY